MVEFADFTRLDRRHPRSQALVDVVSQGPDHPRRTAFPDIRLPIAQLIAEGDRVAVLNAVQGTHLGALCTRIEWAL